MTDVLQAALANLFESEGYSKAEAARMAALAVGANPMADWLAGARPDQAPEQRKASKLSEAKPAQQPTAAEVIAQVEKRFQQYKYGVPPKKRKLTEHTIQLREDAPERTIEICEQGENANLGKVLR